MVGIVQFEMEISWIIVRALNARVGKCDEIVVFRIIKYSMASFLSAWLSITSIFVFSKAIR